MSFTEPVTPGTSAARIWSVFFVKTKQLFVMIPLVAAFLLQLCVVICAKLLSVFDE